MKTNDCRTDDFYNEKYLDECDSQMIVGFDTCIEDCIESFFYNIFEYDMEIHAALSKPGKEYDFEEFDDIDFSILNDGRSSIRDYSEEELGHMSRMTKLCKALLVSMKDWAGHKRDDLITSMIDNMPDHMYEELKKKADKGEYSNAVTRHQKYVEEVKAGNVPTSWEYRKDTQTGEIVRIGICPNGRKVIDTGDD